MPQKKLFLLLFLSFSFLVSFAQQATISGLLKDEQNKPIDHVTIAVEGTDIGTVTDPKGYYMLQVPAGRSIHVVFTYVGYETQRKAVELTTGENRTWDIILKAQSTTLKEFVKKDDHVRN